MSAFANEIEKRKMNQCIFQQNCLILYNQFEISYQSCQGINILVPILLQVPSGDINSEILSVSGLAEQEVTFSKTQNSDAEAYLSFSNNVDIEPPVYVVDDSFYNRFEDLSFEQSSSPVYSKF